VAQTAEAAALVAVLNEDTDEARRVLEDFFPTELHEFAKQVSDLADLIDETLRGKGAR
jgi:hypothetical protein